MLSSAHWTRRAPPRLRTRWVAALCTAACAHGSTALSISLQQPLHPLHPLHQVGTSCCSLTWLCRFLRMLEGLVAALLQGTTELGPCVWAGYQAALSPHHPWLTQRLVKAGVQAAPSRAAFFNSLGVAGGEQAGLRQLRELLVHFSPVLDSAVSLLVERGVEQAG